MKNISLRNKKYIIILFQMKKKQVKHLLSIALIFTYMQVFNKLKDIKYLGKNCSHKQVSVTRLKLRHSENF